MGVEIGAGNTDSATGDHIARLQAKAEMVEATSKHMNDIRDASRE